MFSLEVIERLRASNLEGFHCTYISGKQNKYSLLKSKEWKVASNLQQFGGMYRMVCSYI